MLAQLFDIIAPVLFCAGLGFAWKKAGAPFDSETVTAVATNIGAPCLIVATLTRLQVGLDAFGEMALAAAAALGIFMILGIVVLKLARLPNHTFLPALVFGNTGNTGLPLCLFAFGKAGLALGIAVFTVNALTQFTVGALISSGQFSVRRLVRTPVIYAVALAVGFMVADARPPVFVKNIFEVLGGITIPMMLLALGVSLADLKIDSLGRSVWLAALRLAAGFAVGLGLAELFGFDGAARGVLIIQAAMPAAVFNFLFARYYGRDAEQVAGMVVVSTLMVFVCLPLILAIALDPSLLP